MAEPEALRDMVPDGRQRIGLGLGLDAFGDQVKILGPRQHQHRRREVRIVVVEGDSLGERGI